MNLSPMPQFELFYKDGFFYFNAYELAMKSWRAVCAGVIEKQI